MITNYYIKLINIYKIERIDRKKLKNVNIAGTKITVENVPNNDLTIKDFSSIHENDLLFLATQR